MLKMRDPDPLSSIYEGIKLPRNDIRKAGHSTSNLLLRGLPHGCITTSVEGEGTLKQTWTDAWRFNLEEKELFQTLKYKRFSHTHSRNRILNTLNTLEQLNTLQILEPSKEVALQLCESGHQNLQTHKLGLDMLRHLSLHHDYVDLLLQDGHYLEALRYARRHKVITIRPSLFLEAALSTNDSQQLAAVLRFFSDFTPGFISTAEKERYHQVLTELS